MRKRSFYRGFLIAAGLVAALVIILSQSFSIPEQSDSVATEQTEKGKDQSVIQVPAQANPQSSVVRVDEQVPETVLEVLSAPELTQKIVQRSVALVSTFIETLFRVIIAPNAP